MYSTHRYNMSKDTRLINVICFDHVTRFLCSDWLKCRVTLECDTALVTVNVDIFTCTNFRVFMKIGNFACIKIRVLCIIGSLGKYKSNFRGVHIFADI